MFLEALEDALVFRRFRVLNARDVASAMHILRETPIDAMTIDIMLSPGTGLEGVIKPHNAGYHLCRQVAKDHPRMPTFCMSVVSDARTISKIEKLGISCLRNI